MAVLKYTTRWRYVMFRVTPVAAKDTGQWIKGHRNTESHVGDCGTEARYGTGEFGKIGKKKMWRNVRLGPWRPVGDLHYKTAVDRSTEQESHHSYFMVILLYFEVIELYVFFRFDTCS